MQTQITITGYLVGNIWMPNVECWKHLTYDLTRENGRYSDGKAPLREHLCRIINEGDFQSCSIARGQVEITLRKSSGGKRRCVTKTIPLERFKVAEDFLHDDPDWFPTCPDDDE